MVILRMNRSFDRHGKKFLILLTGLISIAFIGFFTPGESGCAMSSRQNPEVGTLFGSSVSLAQVDFHNSLIAAASRGQAQDHYYSLRGMAAYRAAQKMGVIISDKDVKKFIALSFTQDGKFDKTALDKYLDVLKTQYNMSVYQYQDAIKMLLTIEKFFTIANVESIITPNEVEQLNNQMNEIFEVEVVQFKNDNYKNSVIVTDTVLKDTYDATVAAYTKADADLKKADDAVNALSKNEKATEADRTNSQSAFETARSNHKTAKNNVWLTAPVFGGFVATISYADPRASAEAKSSISESKMKAFFDKNQNEYREFDTAKDSIRKDMLNDETRRVARNMLQQFVNSPEVDDLAFLSAEKRLEGFKALAKAKNIKLIEVAGFTTTSMDVPGIGTEPEVYEAFVSNKNGASEISHVVGGFQGAYITYRTNIVDEQVKTFNDVKSILLSEATSKESERLATAAARKFVVEAQVALDSGRSLKTIDGGKFEAPITFSLNPDSRIFNSYFDGLISVVSGTGANHLTPVFYTQEGAAIGFVKSRKTPKSSLINEESPSYKTMKNIKEEMVNFELMVWLNSKISQHGRN